MGYLFLSIGSVLLAADFALNKIYQGIYSAKPKYAFLFNSLLGLFMALIFFAVNGFRLKISIFSCLLAATMSFLVMLYNIIGFKLLRLGTMAMYTLFLMTGGMVLPYIWGILFFKEEPRIIRTLGLIVIVIGVIISNIGKEKLNLKQSLMCLAVFLLNGCVSIISKTHQVCTVYETVNTEEFIVLQGFFKFITAGILFFIFKNKDKADKKRIPLKSAVIISFGSAVLSGTFSLLQLNVAVTLPASVLYPFNTGLTIIMSALAGVIFFKEKLSVKTVLSIVICFAGTLMFL